MNKLLILGEDTITNNSQIMNIFSKSYLCLDNLGLGTIYSPQNLRKCREAKYFGNNDTYECISCIEGYSLDDDTKTCKQSIKVRMNLRPGFSNCYVENISKNSTPVYSCYSCYNYRDLLITSDTGAKFCKSKEGELAGCTEVYADTNYLNDVYNCTYCDIGYISYYNNFFEKTTCQNIHIRPDKIKEISNDAFNPEEVEHVPAVDGKCSSEKLFTPDGENCYACNNRTVGMVGCKGKCTFNIKKNITLKCEEGMCKTGYIEKTRGVCEPCETINNGCIECHYENTYLDGYYGFKRKRRFSCDQCDNGYLISEDGTCHHCSTLGFYNCKNCGVDTEHDNEIKCVECQDGFFLNEEGKCVQCYKNTIRGKDDTCISCDDVESGGIEGCESCTNVNNQPQCTACKPGFILLQNNYTCLRISSNVQLEELPHCQLTLLNKEDLKTGNNSINTSISNNSKSHFDCVKCDQDYVLLEEDGKIKCFNKNFTDAINPDLCEVFTNLGTDDKPKYSCSICRNSDLTTRVTFQKNNTAFCTYRYRFSELENATEAIMLTDDNDKMKNFNCTECIEENVLHLNKDTNMHYCKYKYYEKNCVVKYCKTCVPGNNYFCQVCLPADYEVSALTGGCIKKMEKEPEVYFKDIFRFKLNQYKQIGGRMMFGPFLSMRGLTNSQINTGHAFLVLLSFKLNNMGDRRNLEEQKSVKTYCEIVESLDETDGEPNIADFDCIGDTDEEEELNGYDLDNIEGSSENNSTNIFEQSNLKELIQNTNLSELRFKNKTTFKLDDFIDLVKFNLDDVKNIISRDYHFDFTLNGSLSKELQEQSFDVIIPLNQIEDKKVKCKFNIKANQIANLKCDLNLEEYKNTYQNFSLKVTEVNDKDNTPIYLSRINEVKLVHDEFHDPKDDEELSDDKKKVIIIVVIVFACLVGVGGLSGVSFCCYKRHRNNNIGNMIKPSTRNPDVIPGSDSQRKRIIPFKQ